MANATSATFVGWYKDKDLTDEFNFGTKVTENMTLYTKWSVDSGDSADDNVTYGTIYYGGRVWLDRNLGATRLASNVDETGSDVCGNYYQWGRGNDGHEKYNSTTSPTQIAWDSKNNDSFITASGSPWTWISGNIPENNNYNTMNNPCPDGFRVPTREEILKLDYSIGGVKGSYHTVYFNELKMLRCGYRHLDGKYKSMNLADFPYVGLYYWASDDFSAYDSHSRPVKYGYTLQFFDALSSRSNEFHVKGLSIRCIKK